MADQAQRDKVRAEYLDQGRFLPGKSSFNARGGAEAQGFYQDGNGGEVFLLLLMAVVSFAFFALGIGLAVHNFYLISAGLATGANWLYAISGALIAWFAMGRSVKRS